MDPRPLEIRVRGSRPFLIGAAKAEELFGTADFDPPNLKFFPQGPVEVPNGLVQLQRTDVAPTP